MLGLLEKDLRLTLTRKQTLLIFVVAALVMGMTMDGSFLVGYLTMLATITAIGTISYDEFDNGMAFLMTLPSGRKTYVLEKYLFSLLLAAAAWCVGLILYAVMSAVRHSAIALGDELPMLLAILPVLYLSAAVMIPLQLKYGSEKSRLALFVLFGVAAILFVGVRNGFGGAVPSPDGLIMALSGLSPAVVLLSLTAVCALLALASYLCSVRIMEKKEF